MDERMKPTLTDDQANHLAYITASPAWTETLVPLLREMERNFQEDLIAVPATRPDRSDDYLRSGILFVRAFLDYPQLMLEEHINREAAEKAQHSEQEYYERRADAGGGPPEWDTKGPWDKDFPEDEY
jgi:hypothetical protein